MSGPLPRPCRARAAARLAPALLLFALAGPDAHAIIRCQLGGRDVNTSNGNETAGLTGILVCREEDGRLQREQELRAGKYVGLDRAYLPDGTVRERRVNERGNSDGPLTERDAKGVLRMEGQYADGTSVGVHRFYFDNAQLERVAAYADGREQARLEYNRDGTLRDLRCAAASVMPDDRAPCGFAGGPAESVLQNGRGRVTMRQTWDQGRLLRLVALREDGSVALEQSFIDGRRVHREFSVADGKTVLRRERVFEQGDVPLRAGGPLSSDREWAASGQAVRDTAFTAGLPVTEQQWYLNGSLRLRRVSEYTPINDGRSRSTLVREESYRDDGSLASRTVARDGVQSGVQRYYDERARMRREERFSEIEPGTRGSRSRLLSRKTWDENGQTLTDDEFFEDGSRKLRQ